MLWQFGYLRIVKVIKIAHNLFIFDSTKISLCEGFIKEPAGLLLLGDLFFNPEREVPLDKIAGHS